MNTVKRFSLFICAIIGLMVAACEMVVPPFIGPTDRPVGNDTIIAGPTDSLIIPAEASDWNIPAEAIDVLKAREICAALESGATTGTKYYVMGYVKKIHNKHADGVTNFGNAQFYMENVKGANSSDDFMAFQVYGPNGKRITDPAAVEVGDFVVIYGELTNYNGTTYETVGKGAAYIWKSTNPLLEEPSEKPTEPEVLIIPEEAKAWDIPAEAIDVLQAREICMSLAAGDSTDEKYYVMGYVKKLHSNHESGVTGYGNAQFYMENVKGKNSDYDFMAYQVYGPNRTKIKDPAVVQEGDFVVVYGKLTNYMGNTYETLGKGSAYIWKSTNPLCVEPEPEPVEVTVFDIDLGTKGKVDTFAIADLAGSGTWKYARTTTNMRTEMKGANSEDWLITPALDLTGMLEASLNFKYKFSAAIPTENQHQYTVLISNDYDGNVANVNNATWIEIKGFPYDVTAYAESGLLSIPAEMLVGTCHIAWKYKTADTAHTWSLKNITVKGMKFLD